MKEVLCFFGMVGAASQCSYKSMWFNIKNHKKYEGQIKQMGVCEKMKCYSPLSGNEALPETMFLSHDQLLI